MYKHTPRLTSSLFYKVTVSEQQQSVRVSFSRAVPWLSISSPWTRPLIRCLWLREPLLLNERKCYTLLTHTHTHSLQLASIELREGATHTVISKFDGGRNLKEEGRKRPALLPLLSTPSQWQGKIALLVHSVQYWTREKGHQREGH